MTHQPEFYLLHVRKVRCLRCEAIMTSSELFACEPQNNHTRKLRPALSIETHLQVQKILLPVRTTPACFACIDSVALPDGEEWSRWQAALAKKKLESRAQASGPSAPALKPIEDLA